MVDRASPMIGHTDAKRWLRSMRGNDKLLKAGISLASGWARSRRGSRRFSGSAAVMVGRGWAAVWRRRPG